MKLEQVSSEIKTNFVSKDGADLGIDTEDMGVILRYLSDDIYSNAIGTIVREYTSNGYDAHIDAGTTDPVRVMIGEDKMGFYFAVQDYGTGMDQETIHKYFKKYGKSSRRNTNECLGAYGLGSKSFASYSDVVYYTTIKDGVERAFALFKGEHANRYESIHEVPTKERNGTTVKIYIKNEDDKHSFIYECRNQLIYFDNLYFDIPGFTNDTYKIVHSKHFAFIEAENGEEERLNPKTSMHILIGNVSYPLDYNVLLKEFPWFSWDMYMNNIAIKFDIGELPITINREAVKYTQKAVKLIGKRIREVCKEVWHIYNNNHRNYDTIQDYIIDFDEENPSIVMSNTRLWLKELIKLGGDKNKLNPLVVAKGRYGQLDFTKFKTSRLCTDMESPIRPSHYLSSETARLNRIPFKEKPKSLKDIIEFLNKHKDKTLIADIDFNTDVNKQIVYDTKAEVYLVNSFYVDLSASVSIRAIGKVFPLINGNEADVAQAAQVLELMRKDILKPIKQYSDLTVDKDRIADIRKFFRVHRTTSSRNSTILTYNVPFKSGRARKYVGLDSKKIQIRDEYGNFTEFFTKPQFLICALKGTDDDEIRELFTENCVLYGSSYYIKYSWGFDWFKKHNIKVILISKNKQDMLVDELSNAYTLDGFFQSKFMKDKMEDAKIAKKLHGLFHSMSRGTRASKLKNTFGYNIRESYNKLTDLHPYDVPMEYEGVGSIKLSDELIAKCNEISDIYDKFEFLDGVNNTTLGEKIAIKYAECENITL